LLFLSDTASDKAAARPGKAEVIEPTGPPTIRRVEPNVLTLDYVDVTVGDQTLRNAYFYAANRLVFQKHGLPGNPWDSSVQFRDELITKTFPADSGFSATYRFTIERRVPKPLTIVIERPDLYTITCNGKPVSGAAGEWWLDRCFGRVEITQAAKVGENEVTITASPMTMFHELEPAYLLGDFSLKPAERGFVVEPAAPLELGVRDAHVTTPEGTMWLSGGIGFANGDAPDAKDGRPWIVFDLGSRCDVEAVKIWNYNEVNLTARGVKQLRITGLRPGEGELHEIPLGTFDLDEAR
jgi:hypothetical protein